MKDEAAQEGECQNTAFTFFLLFVCLFVYFFWERGGGQGGVWIAMYFVQDGFWLWGCKTPSKSIFDTQGSV